MRDHVIGKMENLDKTHSQLEYHRQTNELRTREARDVLSGAALVAGDFDCVISGVYGIETPMFSELCYFTVYFSPPGEGDVNLSSDASNQELVPLLQKLLALLESGSPFILSPQVLNLLQGGNTNIYESVHQGGASVQLGGTRSAGVGPVQPVTAHGLGTGVGAHGSAGAPAGGAVTSMTLLQQSPGVSGGVQQAVGGAGKSVDQSESVMEFSNLDTPATNDVDREEQKRNLLTKQVRDATRCGDVTRC